MQTSPTQASRQLDQFYTDRSLATTLVARTRAFLATLVDPKLRDPASQATWSWLEPSAGAGAFLSALPPETLALDIDPHGPGILPADFLTFTPPHPGPWVVVGNPPFGKNASLACRFFNHAASFAEVIAFIVPRTFEKDSMHRRLHPSMHLKVEIALDPASFTRDNEPVSVPCVFQIWHRQAQPRPVATRHLVHADFAFVTRPEADFAFQRVGAAAGRIKSLNHPALAPPSHHFLRATDRSQVAAVRARFESICWNADKYRTAGNPSIGKHEMIRAYQKALATHPSTPSLTASSSLAG